MANHQFPMINIHLQLTDNINKTNSFCNIFLVHFILVFLGKFMIPLSYFFQLAFSGFWHWSQFFFSMFRLNLFLFFFHSPLWVILIQGWQYWPTSSCHLSQNNFYIFKYGADKINISLFAAINIFDLMDTDMFAFVVNSSELFCTSVFTLVICLIPSSVIAKSTLKIRKVIQLM